MILGQTNILEWFESSWPGVLVGICLTLVGIVVTWIAASWFDKRHRLIKDIQLILKKCRECENWNDRSEMKLFQWLLETPEEEIHNCRTIKLWRIKQSVRDYLHLHLYGRAPTSPPGRVERFFQNVADRLRSRRENKVR